MGQREPVRAQLSTLSPRATMKPCREMPGRSIPAAASRSRITPIRSLPFEGSLLPLVDEAHHEDAEEDQHRDEAEPADVLQHDRPGEEEGDLEVEEDEEDRNQVVAHVELHARVLEGLEAALVGGELLAVGVVRPREPGEAAAHDDRPDTDRGADGEEQKDRKIVGEQCGIQLNQVVPSKRLELLRLSALPPQDSVSTNSTTTAFDAVRRSATSGSPRTSPREPPAPVPREQAPPVSHRSCPRFPASPPECRGAA